MYAFVMCGMTMAAAIQPLATWVPLGRKEEYGQKYDAGVALGSLLIILNLLYGADMYRSYYNTQC